VYTYSQSVLLPLPLAQDVHLLQILSHVISSHGYTRHSPIIPLLKELTNSRNILCAGLMYFSFFLVKYSPYWKEFETNYTNLNKINISCRTAVFVSWSV
jgi:hypothetical protein